MNRVVRSTSVPIAELPRPRMRSPSQCPGTARSSASAGRSLIRTSSVTKLLPAPRPGSRDPQRPAGAQARGQLASAARHGPAHTATGRSPRARYASTHHPGSPDEAGERSAPGSRTSPSAGPCAGRDAGRSTRPRDRPQQPPSGRCTAPDETVLHIPPQLGVARPASPASDAARAGPHATARCWPGTPDRRRESRRYDAAHERSSTGERPS